MLNSRPVACLSGTWGTDCLQLCNCLDATTPCLPATGCTQCLPGWTGGSCYINIDECLTPPCGANSTCVDSPGSFACVCDPGFEKVDQLSCIGMY